MRLGTRLKSIGAGCTLPKAAKPALVVARAGISYNNLDDKRHGVRLWLC